MAKNLTFKLVMEADTKSFVGNVKQSESVAKSVFDAIKTESDKLKQSSAEAAKEIGNIIPSDTKQKVGQLVSELHNATKALDSLGDDATVSASNLKQLGNYGSAALNSLQNDLKQAKLHLNYLSATNATPADIENAQREVKELETGVKQVKTAFDAYSGAASSAIAAVDNVGDQSAETAQQVKQLDKELETTTQELSQTEQASKGVSSELQGLKTGFNALTGALAALGIGVTASEIAQTADAYKNLSGRISIAIGDHGNLEKAMDDVKNVAIATNSNLEATGELYARLTKIGQEMKWPQEQALALTETINKAIQVGGGSAASNEAAITQLNQALGSGVLRGDEFNSMMEQSPRLAQALADGLGVTTGKLRELAGEGKLTTEVVTQALLSQSEKITAEFDKFPATIGASIENLKTAWTVYIGEADAATGASTKVAEAIKFVAENLDTIVSTLTLAGQAFIAYKALNIGLAFLDKARSVQAASTAITQETAAVVANTQAQIANANASKANAAAKTQLATNSKAVTASTAATGSSIMTLVGRLGTLGIAITSLGVMGGAIVGMLTPLGEWLGEAIAKTEDYVFNNGELAKSLEKLEQQELLEAARAKVVAESKAEIAAAAEKSREKTYQLTEESKKLIEQFDELIAKGGSVKESLEKISSAMQFDSTKGINDAVTSLIALNNQGKITSDELQANLSKALDGKDLLVFETNARAAFAGTAKEAEKSAALTEAVMRAALERTGLSTEQLQGRFSKTFQSSANDVQIILDKLDEYKAKGIDTGLALSSNLNKAIDTAQTRAELDYVKSKLLELERQGIITGEQVALGLSKIEQKGGQLPAALEPAIAAFSALGIKTKEQLNDAAIAAQKNFDVVSKSGQATAEGIKQAYTKMLEAAIATGDKAQIASVQAKAASQGLRVEIDETGKASVKAMDDLTEANHRVRESARSIGDGYREAGQIAREEANAAQIAWNKASQEAAQKWDAEMKRQSKGLSAAISGYQSMSKNDVISQIKSMGYSEDQAKKLAGSIWSQAMATDRDAKFAAYGKGGNLAMNKLIEQEFNNAAAKGLTTQHGTNKINELLRNLDVRSTGSVPKVNDYAPNISEPKIRDLQNDAPTKNVRFEFVSGGKHFEMQGSQEDGDTMESILREFEMLKKAM
ncbi:MAG TPA: tape measure protein [Acinetobacter towneri]|nr:tape measure protein [Acinetobacter towneri]